MRDKHVIQVSKNLESVFRNWSSNTSTQFFKNQFLEYIARNQFFIKNSIEGYVWIILVFKNSASKN
jgi:hypothetical protein